MSDALLFFPEICVLISCLILFGISVADFSYNFVWRISVLLSGLVLAACLVTLTAQGQPFFPGIYAVDGFSQLLKLGIALGLSLTLLVSGNLASFRKSTRLDVPFFMFISTAGMMMLVSATELLTLYVALELSAYGMFILVAFSRAQRLGSEAAIKYMLYGAAASAVTLYGLSLIFGVTGSTYLSDVYTAGAAARTPLFLVGVLLTLSGFFFKLAVFPFASWAPDTYQAAPHQVATFLGTVSKVAAVGVLARGFTMAAWRPADLVWVIFTLAVVSMTFGNLAALVQRDLKRLLAYSAVAHAGYMLVGLIGFSETGMASAVFYGIAYVVMGFGAFQVVCWLGRDGSNPTFESLNGLHKRNPLLALVLLASMFGLAGIPPTPGFAGKWFLFAAAVEQGHFVLVLLAAINATISLYYYLMVVKAAYLDPAEDETPFQMSTEFRFTAALVLLLTMALGILPGPLWDLAVIAAKAVLPI